MRPDGMPGWPETWQIDFDMEVAPKPRPMKDVTPKQKALPAPDKEG